MSVAAILDLDKIGGLQIIQNHACSAEPVSDVRAVAFIETSSSNELVELKSDEQKETSADGQ